MTIPTVDSFLTLTLGFILVQNAVGIAGAKMVGVNQTLAAVLLIVLLLFRCMGRDYQAAVLSAGFGGFALGATPVAVANMAAVTKANGPAPVAFIILPLVAAFFVDMTNSVVIQFLPGILSL